MKIKEILKTTTLRPWKLPSSPWMFYQEWNNVIFLHYKVAIEDLRRFVPYQLEIDTYDSQVWISVVAFTMENVRPKYLPTFPPISNFDEINIRTYVRSNGKAGVYFLSIEAGNLISCKLAKALSGLPYRYSKIERKPNLFLASNSEFKDHLTLEYSDSSAQAHKSGLDLWLTEKYALFQDDGNSIHEFEIHHLEWSIQNLHLQKCELHYPRFNHLFQSAPDLIHYSPGVQVLTWPKNSYLAE